MNLPDYFHFLPPPPSKYTTLELNQSVLRLMVACGLSRPALRDRAAECRERGAEFILPLEPVLKGLRKQEEKEK